MNVIANSAILFGVVFFAVRQITRSEAATESLLGHKPVQPMRLRAMVNQLLRSYERTIAPAAE
jgi:hypothetical protein